MKIAVCLSGSSNKFRRGFYELKKWFLDKYDCDIYIHTWNTHNDLNNLLSLYQPKDYYFQDLIPFDFTNIKSEYTDTFLNDILNESYSTHASYNLAKESEIEYDLIIQLKFNLKFTHCISPECIFLQDLSQIEYNKLNVFSYGFSTETDSLFAVSTPIIAEIYADCFTFILHNVFMNPDYESWLFKNNPEKPDKINLGNLITYNIIKDDININQVNSLTDYWTTLLFV